MGSTITTTTSPPTLLQIHQIAAVPPASEPPLLTSPSRPASQPSIAAPAALARRADTASEPPPKRPRLEQGDSQRRIDHANNQLTACLQRQVFPHVDAQIATLPKDRVNALSIGKQVVALLTGPEFSQEYNRRGDGTISWAFESKLADLAALHVQSLARRLVQLSQGSRIRTDGRLTRVLSQGHQLVPSSTAPQHHLPSGTTLPTPAPAPQPRVETRVPLPRFEHYRPAEPIRTASVPKPAPKISTSPIPVPAIPSRTPTNSYGGPNGARPGSRRTSGVTPAEGSRLQPVIVDDDGDETPPPKPALTQKSVAAAPPEPRRRSVPKIETPRQAPLPKREPSTASPAPPPVRPPPRTPAVSAVTPPPAAPSTLTIRSSPVAVRAPTAAALSAAPPAFVTPPIRSPALAVTARTVTAPTVTAPTVTAPTVTAPTVTAPTVTSPPPAVSQARQSTPQDWRTEAHALIWRGRGPPANDKEASPARRLTNQRRPYITAAQRASIIGGTQKSLQLRPADLTTPVAFHIDFTNEEIKYINNLTRRTLRLSRVKDKKDPKRDLYKVLKKNPSFVPAITDAFTQENRLPGRTREDVRNLIQDLVDKKHTAGPAILTVARDSADQRGDLIRSSRVHSLLLAREISGQRGVGSMRCMQHFNNEFRKCREDELEKRAEWTGCAGDIATIAWVSGDSFICGTTEHSDSHNQRYNKPGNLVLGSCTDVTLRAYPEHRIVRPLVELAANATEQDRETHANLITTLDPWLYSSVVSSDYDAVHDRAFTSSFDRTVKVWKVQKSGASMSPLGEWKHDGNVNFVASSKHESGMVATAADVAADAVRIYNIDSADISRSPFRSYSCSRVTDDRGNTVSTEKWAYFPATMQWGLAPKVRHLLLVGYSPRSRTGEDNDIPDERRTSGELCLWDGITGERWNVTAATTLNVFEVLWHPTQESFIAATSPSGLDLEPSVRTQIRIFRPADRDVHGAMAYSPIMILDCTAIDVNELTIMPNSFSFCYVTAGCTDGNTYVWDTARGDKPIHILRHGEPIDEYRGDREREDVGVKFTAWGTTPDRFYTGSSDGVLKVWNVRTSNKPLVRNLLEAPAPITAGMFCPDKSRLVVGDASGRVFMLSINDEKEQPMSVLRVPLPGSGGFRTIRRPPGIIPHPDPPAPTHDAEGRPILSETGPASGRAYLDNLQLERHPNPTIGVVQGPRYAEIGLFNNGMHFENDPSQPLLAQWEALQQEAWKPPSRPFQVLRRRQGQGIALKPLKEVPTLEEVHLTNKGLDLDLDLMTRLSLEEERVDLNQGDDYLLREEE